MLLTIHLFEHTHHSWQNIREGEERERRVRRGEGKKEKRGKRKKKEEEVGDALFIHGEEEQQNSKKEQHTPWMDEKKCSIDHFDRFLFLLRSKKEKTSRDVSIILLCSL